MKPKKYKPKELNLGKFYPIFLVIATLFMGVAYAQISDVELNITGTTTGDAQDGVFITDIAYKSNVSADAENSSINYYLGTMMDSKVVLGSSSSSSITYEVTMYNSTDKDYVFIGALVDKTDATLYSNTNITYSVNIEEYETIIAPKESLKFEVTFNYTGTDVSNNTLESKINFRFREKPIVTLSNEGETYTLEDIYPGYTTQEYEFTVMNYSEDETEINGVPMTYSLEIEMGSTSPLTAKIYDENGTEVTGSISLEGDGVTKTSTKYTLKISWDETVSSEDYASQEYTCNVKLKAIPEDETYSEYKITKEFNVNIAIEYIDKVYLTDLSSTTGYFKESTYKTAIKNIYFTDYVDTTSAVTTYDLSEEQNQRITGWITDNGDSTYNLYIGSDFNIYAKSLENAFYYMTGVENIYFDNLNTSETTTMSNMFYNCSSLTSLDVSNFDTSSVTNMSYMFYECSSLTSLDLSNFDTSSVTIMSKMFDTCSSLTSLDLSNFDTSKVTEMTYMFYQCSSLTSLDMRLATFDSVTSYTHMFTRVNSSIEIIVKDETAKTWVEDKLSSGTVVIAS